MSLVSWEGGIWWLRRFVPSSWRQFQPIGLQVRPYQHGVLSYRSAATSGQSSSCIGTYLQPLPHWSGSHWPKPDLVQETGNCFSPPKPSQHTFRVCPCGRPFKALECVSTFHSQAPRCGRSCPFSPSGRSPRRLVGACLGLSTLVFPWQCLAVLVGADNATSLDVPC